MTKAGNRWRIAVLFAALAMTGAALPASAHEQHKKEQAAERPQIASRDDRTSQALRHGPPGEHGDMGEMMGESNAHRSNLSFGARLLDWLGRLHPVIVHFPIAFFPAALFTALVGRRRPAFASPVQFLVVAGCIVAPISAGLGWLDAMTADPGRLLTIHRWLGTAIGIAALPLGVWAWRRPDQTRGAGMIGALSAMTAAIVLQGWYGGALVHGIEHMHW